MIARTRLALLAPTVAVLAAVALTGCSRAGAHDPAPATTTRAPSSSPVASTDASVDGALGDLAAADGAVTGAGSDAAAGDSAAASNDQP